MATQFLASDQEVSDIINPNGHTPSGSVLIAFFGTMVSDEKWQIEQAEHDKDEAARTWVAVHSTDFLTAQAALGTSVSPTSAPVNLWEGPRAGNRVFEIPLGRGFVYRVKLVYKNGVSNIPSTGTNSNDGNVTACWAEAKTKLWL